MKLNHEGLRNRFPTREVAFKGLADVGGVAAGAPLTRIWGPDLVVDALDEELSSEFSVALIFPTPLDFLLELRFDFLNDKRRPLIKRFGKPFNMAVAIATDSNTSTSKWRYK